MIVFLFFFKRNMSWIFPSENFYYIQSLTKMLAYISAQSICIWGLLVRLLVFVFLRGSILRYGGSCPSWWKPGVRCLSWWVAKKRYACWNILGMEREGLGLIISWHHTHMPKTIGRLISPKWTKWPPFRRRYFQTNFREWKFSFRSKHHPSLFLKVQLTITQHCFR